MREVMKKKLKSVWNDLRQDEKTKVILLPIAVVISLLTFGLCICIKEDKDCDVMDVIFLPVDFFHAHVQMLFNGFLKSTQAFIAGIKL